MITQDAITNICSDAGISVNGSEPWSLQVNNEAFYARVLGNGSLGLGEAYMEGWWDCDDLFGFFSRLLSTPSTDTIRHAGWRTQLAFMQAKLINVQTPAQSRQLADVHYNLSNELFEHMLGPTMAYSCAYWKDVDNLDEAQRAKYDLICRKLKLKPGERVLDIGCGWGGLAKYATEHFGVEVVGITIAQEQCAYARRMCTGLPVTIACRDYREFDHEEFGGLFDKIVSVGMIEHVGYRNYATMMDVAAKALKSRGLFLLHTIGSTTSETSADAWIDKYIFPGGVLPSMAQLTCAAEGRFVLQDVQNIGVHYIKTLLAWHTNFETYWHDAQLESARPKVWGSHDTFYRMWRYYLLMSAGNFNAGGSQVWQLVLAKDHLPRGYTFGR